MLDCPYKMGWKRCPGCRYSHDAEGYNLLNPKPLSTEDLTTIDSGSTERDNDSTSKED